MPFLWFTAKYFHRYWHSAYLNHSAHTVIWKVDDNDNIAAVMINTVAQKCCWSKCSLPASLFWIQFRSFWTPCWWVHHAGYSFVSVLQHNSERHFSQSHVATLSESNLQNNDIFLAKKSCFLLLIHWNLWWSGRNSVPQSCYLRVK